MAAVLFEEIGVTAAFVDELTPRLDADCLLTLVVLLVAEVDEVGGAPLNGGALESGCGLLAPLPANVPVVVPFPPKLAE